MGLLGGHPSLAHYFVGARGNVMCAANEEALKLIVFPADDELLYLDPHTTQTHFPFDSEGFKPSV